MGPAPTWGSKQEPVADYLEQAASAPADRIAIATCDAVIGCGLELRGIRDTLERLLDLLEDVAGRS